MSGLMKIGETYVDGQGLTRTIEAKPFQLGTGSFFHVSDDFCITLGAIQGPPGVLHIGFTMQLAQSNTPCGPWAGGNGCQAYCRVGELIKPPYYKIVPGIITAGTYGGSCPFHFENPINPISISVDKFFGSMNPGRELDKIFGVGKWGIDVVVAYPVCSVWIRIDSTRVCSLICQFGFVKGCIAQSIPPGIFDIHPEKYPGAIGFSLDAIGFPPIPQLSRYRVYHETKIATTITPISETIILWGTVIRISATPYPFHRLVSFTIRGTVRRAGGVKQEITKEVPITDPYGTTVWKWNIDDHSVADWLLDKSLGVIESDVYVSAISTYTATKTINAGKPVSIQCETNECCAPTWAITNQDAETLNWGLSIDPDGLITGFIPRDTPLGTYGIEVTVTGPTQSTSAKVYVEVLDPLIYGNVWVGSALLPGATVTDLIEVGDKIYASTAPSLAGPGHIYYANKSNLTAWMECTYSAAVPGILALAKLNDNILAAMDGTGKIWVCLDGVYWTQKSNTYVIPDGADSHNANLFPINSSMVLWIPQRGALTTVSAYVIDVITDTLISSADIGGGWNLIAYAQRAAYSNGIAILCAHGNSGAMGLVKFTINTVTGAITLVGKTLNLDSHWASDHYSSVTHRHGTFVAINDKILYESSDGVTWTVITNGEAPLECDVLYSLSPRSPNNAFLAIHDLGTCYRTVDRFAHSAIVKANTCGWSGINGVMIELLDGTLVMGDSGSTHNIWVSTE